MVHYKSRMVGFWTETCTDKRLPIVKGSDYCGMCYRKLLETKGDDGKLLDFAHKKALCKSSTMGCPQYEESLRELCWLEGYDMHT